MIVLKASKYVDIKPVVHGGNGRLKALALLGDRLLDIVLYQDMLREGMVHEGRMSQRRGMCVANATLAKAGETLLTPHVLPMKKYRLLSPHEKGTMVEAYLGALLEQNNFDITPDIMEVVRDVLRLLQEYMSSKAVAAHASQYKVNPTIKKCKPQLLEIFQRRGIENASTFFSCVSYGRKPNLPPFVVTFKAPYNLTYCGLPDVGVVTSSKKTTKKDAEEEVAQRVLDIFLSNEKMVFGDLVKTPEEPQAKKRKTSCDNDGGEVEDGAGSVCKEPAGADVDCVIVDDALYDVQVLQDNGKVEKFDLHCPLTRFRRHGTD